MWRVVEGDPEVVGRSEGLWRVIRRAIRRVVEGDPEGCGGLWRVIRRVVEGCGG